MSKKKSNKKSISKKTSRKWPKMLADDTVVEENPIEEVNPETETESPEPESESNELNLEFAEDEGDESLEFTSDDDSGIEAEESETDIEVEISGDSEEDTLSAASLDDEDSDSDDLGLDNSELGSFEAAQIEDVETIPPEQLRSIIESILFTTDKPISIALIKQAFKGTQIKSKDIREALLALSEEYNQSARGFTLDEIAGGFQLRTKADNLKYLRQGVKARPFRLSGPALEVLSIVAYKQPTTKHQIDEIRGVESGHLLRALMEKHLLTFGERSDLPGKPMFYETTRKFLEIFGLRNLQELPSLHEIDQLIPEGIGGDEEKKKETLSDLTGELSEQVGSSYSVGEEELLKITDELSTITTSSEFFEQEKERQRQKRDADRAQDIREKQIVGEAVEAKDVRWLERFDAAQAAAAQSSDEVEFVTEGIIDEASAEISEEHLDEMLADDEDEAAASSDEPPAHVDSEAEPEAQA
jgi:segregation and condensation protein B